MQTFRKEEMGYPVLVGHLKHSYCVFNPNI
uniref:Uncharacterized protein n=1 Tax=Anguilla anguilla TaxID=7936 RepID=A0A0E9UZ34_ANGAN